MSCRVFLCKCSVGLGLGIGMWTLRVFPRTVSEREQTWSLFVCFFELLGFACVKSEGSVVPFVRLTILEPVYRVHK